MLWFVFVVYCDLKVVYFMGFGNVLMFEVLCVYVLDLGFVVVVYDLMFVMCQVLVDGEVDVIIVQNVGYLVCSVLRVLWVKCDDIIIYEVQEQICIEIILWENFY